MKRPLNSKQKNIIILSVFIILVVVGISVGVITFKTSNVSSSSLNSDVYSFDTDDNADSHLTSTEKSDFSAVSRATNVKTTTNSVLNNKTTSIVTTTSDSSVQTYSFSEDINKAVKGQLISVKGIGEIMADKIIDYRKSVGTIHNMNELKNVSGIGDAKLLLLEKYFFVDDNDFREITTTTRKAVVAQAPIATSVSIRKEKTDNTVNTEKSKTVTTKAVLQKVNINTADATEIASKLLLTDEQAQDIVYTRSLITKYSSFYELFLCTKITQKEIQERENYIEV